MAATPITAVPTSDSTRFKTRLLSVYAAVESPQARRYHTVIFDVTPDISVSRSTEYTQLNPIHLPGTIFVYKNTGHRTFTLTAKFVSRTPQEAENNLRYRQLLQSWQLPFFGLGSRYYRGNAAARNAEYKQEQQNRANLQGTDSASRVGGNSGGQTGDPFLGAPPEVLYFYAYADATNPDVDKRSFAGSGVNLQRIPVVLSDFNFSLPVDVDYIPTLKDKIPFPIVYTASITLLETHSPREFETFSLENYRRGRLEAF